MSSTSWNWSGNSVRQLVLPKGNVAAPSDFWKNRGWKARRKTRCEKRTDILMSAATDSRHHQHRISNLLPSLAALQRHAYLLRSPQSGATRQPRSTRCSSNSPRHSSLSKAPSPPNSRRLPSGRGGLEARVDPQVSSQRKINYPNHHTPPLLEALDYIFLRISSLKCHFGNFHP